MPTKIHCNHLATALRGLAAESGVSWRDIARDSGLSIGCVQAIMNGRTVSPRYESLLAILVAIGSTIDDLMARQKAIAKRLSAHQFDEGIEVQ
jgi:transcriptional regulator with XRE-family HTH domain